MKQKIKTIKIFCSKDKNMNNISSKQFKYTKNIQFCQLY